MRGPRPAHAEAPGLLLGGKLILHPSLATELRYDSNVYFANSVPTWAMMLRLVPSLSLSTLAGQRGLANPDQRALFRLQGSLDYREFLSPAPTPRVHRMLGGEVGAQLSLRLQGASGLDFYDFYQRATQPPYSALPYNFNRNLNTFGLRGRIAPGSGRLQTTIGAELGYDGYEDNADGPKLSDFNLISGTLNLRLAWKFLPKTSIFAEVSQAAYHYLNTVVTDLQGRSDSFPLRAALGLVGLITPKLSVEATAGYGYGFYLRGPSPSTWLVHAEGRWKPTQFSAVTLGYRHDFNNAVLGSYFDLNSLGASYTHNISRVMVSVRLSWDRMAFQGSEDTLRNSSVCQGGITSPCIPQLDRVDNLITADARAEYLIRDWISASLGYGLTTNQSNGLTLVANNQVGSVSYVKHEAWLRATLRY